MLFQKAAETIGQDLAERSDEFVDDAKTAGPLYEGVFNTVARIGRIASRLLITYSELGHRQQQDVGAEVPVSDATTELSEV